MEKEALIEESELERPCYGALWTLERKL